MCLYEIISKYMSDEKIIEVKLTKEYIEELKDRGISEDDLPKVGTIKRYRPSPHITKQKLAA